MGKVLDEHELVDVLPLLLLALLGGLGRLGSRLGRLGSLFRFLRIVVVAVVVVVVVFSTLEELNWAYKNKRNIYETEVLAFDPVRGRAAEEARQRHPALPPLDARGDPPRDSLPRRPHPPPCRPRAPQADPPAVVGRHLSFD